MFEKLNVVVDENGWWWKYCIVAREVQERTRGSRIINNHLL